MYQVPTEYYKQQQYKLEELTNQSSQRILSFWQHILLVASSIDGILISLHVGSSEYQCIRWAFLLSIGLLTLGVLTTSIVLYDHTMLLEQCRQKYAQEVCIAIQEDRKLNGVGVNKRKRTIIFEWTSVILLMFSFLSMLSYAILRELLT